uniref:Uncharacterized protein n=1 Tax=Ignisphaera aggregans TaxID=334771 RepID=A0A7C2VBC3_9CREN
MASAVRPQVLLSLALLRELYNKVNYYKSMIDRNVRQYNEYKEKISRIMPEKIRSVDKEIEMLNTLGSHLNSMALFLEGVILRLETLVTAGNVVVAALALKNVVKILRQNLRGVPPILAVLVDKLDELSNNITREIQLSGGAHGSVKMLSPEASKIVEEAKKVAGIK